MSFTFYGYLDQKWIDNKIEEYNLNSCDIKDLLEEYGFEAKQLIDSPNPIIYCLINLIIDQLMEKRELENANLSEDLLERIREDLRDTIFVNCLDSHLQALDVFESYKEEIHQNLIDNCQDSLNGIWENPEDPEIKKQIQEQMEKLENLFSEYDF
jgi:hypothetical protein